MTGSSRFSHLNGKAKNRTDGTEKEQSHAEQCSAYTSFEDFCASSGLPHEECAAAFNAVRLTELTGEDRQKAEALLKRFPNIPLDDAAVNSVLATVEFARDRLVKHAEARSAAATHAGHRARLRETARQDPDLGGMSDIQLIELLLSFLVPQRDTNVTAHRLTDKYSSVLGVLRAPATELARLAAVPVQTAALLPMLAFLCITYGCSDIKLQNRACGADFFGSYLGNGDTDTCVAYLNDRYEVIAVESYPAGGVPVRDTVCAVCKYCAKYVFLARRTVQIFPDEYDLASGVADLSETVAAVGGRVLDFLIFTDYGYYTVCVPPRDGQWHPTYAFVPSKQFAGSAELYDAAETARVRTGGAADMAAQLAAVLKGGPASDG